MTFWDFYGQHPVLGTIVGLVSAPLLVGALVVVETVFVAWAHRPRSDAERP